MPQILGNVLGIVCIFIVIGIVVRVLRHLAPDFAGTFKTALAKRRARKLNKEA